MREINAIGHEKTFSSTQHPAVTTLRRLWAFSRPFDSCRIQMGAFNPSLGVHENYDVKEFDLDRFIKRGRLISLR